MVKAVVEVVMVKAVVEAVDHQNNGISTPSTPPPSFLLLSPMPFPAFAGICLQRAAAKAPEFIPGMKPIAHSGCTW